MAYKCPKHKVNLRTIEDYPGALVHNGCPELFIVIDDQLCILEGKEWKDTKTGEVKLTQVSSS